MCGRAYETYSDEELYFQYLNKRPLRLLPISRNFNMCPTQDSPVLRLVNGERQFDLMQWQLIPEWEPTFKTKLSTINAKSETVFESRLYRKLIVGQRCIVPLSGFFEWKRGENTKQPFKIYMQDNSIMSVAGLWSIWHPDTTEQRFSFSILTTAANKFMSTIHDRMPVIVGRSDWDAWLDPEIHERDALQDLLKPCPNDWLSAVEVSPLVNSPKNNKPEVLRPVAAKTASTS